MLFTCTIQLHVDIGVEKIKYSVLAWLLLCVSVCVCVIADNGKALIVETQNFNMLFHMIIARSSSALGIVWSRSRHIY